MATVTRPPFNKLCELEDFADPELREALRDVHSFRLGVLPDYPEGACYRGDWEAAMAVRAFRHFGALHAEAVVLGVGAGMAYLLFYLTRHVIRLFAADRYLAADESEAPGFLAMLSQPALVAPYDFDPSRLVVQHMDGRVLQHPDDTFDGVFSAGWIHHAGDLEDVANAAYEMGRVLKPGGVLSLATVYRVAGPPGGMGWPGSKLLLSAAEIERFVVEASGLEPVDELRTTLSEATLATPRDLRLALDHPPDALARPADDEPTPHLLQLHMGYVVTSVHLTLRKTESHPVRNNRWARPREDTRQRVARESETVLVRRSAPLPTVDTGAGDDGATAPGRSGSWATTVDAMEHRLGAQERCTDETARRLGELEHLSERIDEHVEDIRRRLADARMWRDQSSLLLGRAEGWRPPDVSPPLADLPVFGPTTPAGHSHPAWQTHEVTLTGGLRFKVVVDPRVDDPVAHSLANGWTSDEAHIDLMLRFLGPGQKLLDLGAHLGSFSLAAAAAGAEALAVEASPSNVALLRESARQNGFSGLEVALAAAYERPGTLAFIADGPWGQVVDTKGATSVVAVTIDHLLTELNWEPVTFVKMDIEGAEPNALRGMTKLLGEQRPMLLYESNGHTLWQHGSSPEELITHLEGLGYTSFLVDPPHLYRVSSNEIQPHTVADYLASPEPLPAIEGWQVEPALSDSERASRISVECHHGNEFHRSYMAQALESAAPSLLSAPPVVRALDSLLEDPVEGVRTACRWWAQRRRPVARQP